MCKCANVYTGIVISGIDVGLRQVTTMESSSISMKNRNQSTTTTCSKCIQCFTLRKFNHGIGSLLTISLKSLLIFAFFVTCVSGNQQCMPGMDNFAGVTIPRGDIFLHVGDTLEIYCILNQTHPKARGYNSSNLRFLITKPRTFDSSSIRKTIINETTALMRVDHLNATKVYVRCLLETDTGVQHDVCVNEVDVGYTPIKPTDFKCVSHNWTTLECTWSQPENPLKTDYTLTFIEKRGIYPCPNITNKTRRWRCIWSEGHDPHYRANVIEFKINLEGRNRLNTKGVTWNYTVDHFSIVIPEPPKIEELEAKNAKEIYLRWSFRNFRYFSPGLEHEIRISNSETGYRNTTNLVTSEKTDEASTLVDVPYAFTDYTIEIRMRSRTANKSDEGFWSRAATNFTKTLSEKPESPQVNIGSFEVGEEDEGRVVRVYWEDIPPHRRNGPDFRYHINLSENGLTWNKFTTIEPFFKKKLESGKEYRVTINSANDIGYGPNEATLIIPSVKEAPPKVKSVTKVSYPNGSYEIVWTPSAPAKTESYTVFRCLQNVNQQCNVSNSLDWDVVNAGEGYRKLYDGMDLIQLYKFAVSANTRKTSSGMMWESCYLDQKHPVTLNGVSVIDKSMNQVKISWLHECSYVEGYMDGYEIMYCRIGQGNSSRDAECESNTEQAFVAATDDRNEYVIKNLTSQSNYKIIVSVQNKFKNGEKVTTNVQTLAGEPSDPPVVEIIGVYNTSINVSVTPPKRPNGKIITYKFYLKIASSSTGQVEEKPFAAKSQAKTIFRIPDLMSNVNYSIEVAACNQQACSVTSLPIFGKTKQGATQMREPPQLSYGNGIFKVKWDAPKHAGGKVETFELLVLRNGEELKEQIPNAIVYEEGRPEYDQEIQLNCDLNTNLTARVRAITITEDDQQLVGNWSQEGSVACVGASGHVILIICILSVVAVILLAIVGKKTYSYFKECADVDLRLPPGIEKELYPCNPVQKRKPEVIGDKDSMTFPLKPNGYHRDDRNGVLPSIKYSHENDLADGKLDGDKNKNAEPPGLEFTGLNSNDASHNEHETSAPWLWQGVPSDESMIADSNHVSQNPDNFNNFGSMLEDWSKGTSVSPSVLNPLLPPTNRSTSEDCNSRSNPSPPEPYKRLGMFSSRGDVEEAGNEMVLTDLPLSSDATSQHTVADQLSSPSSSSTSSTSSTSPSKTSNSRIVPDVITTNNAPYVRWNQLPEFKNDTLISPAGAYCQVGMF